MRIALLGANGQLGTDLRRVAAGVEVVALVRPDFDVCDATGVAARLRALAPDAVINCAAMTHVDKCEESPGAAFAVNAVGAGNVARACAALDTPLLHISTDYVFGADAERAQPYDESDTPGPLNVYGVSKLAGEYLVRVFCPRHFIVRTSGLFGLAGARGKGGNFVETMLKLAEAGNPILVVNDQRLSPTSTRELAARLLPLLASGQFGTYHVAARDHCTWFEFATAIFEHERVQVDLSPIPSEEYPTPARRPALSALTSTRLAGVGIAPCPDWRSMLHDYLVARRARAERSTAAATSRAAASTPAVS
jgi:dTDP-4-dehydrorhamnose reductase